MHKRPPRLALLLLTAAAFGTTACDASGTDASAPSASTSPSPSPSASAAPAPEGRGLQGPAAGLFLKTLREHHPDLDHIEDDALVAEGDALCTVRGAALGEQFTKSTHRLGTTKKQTSSIMGAAHALCRDKDDQLFAR
ncbi:hypothetical protein [Streptomyces sp. KL118A]|uniref:hypothetical protein n=1 Tax=Streptomyces sp. KL118A TaxID=3045153 RepID=UPI00278C0EF8|nr:hypothetical protein [Streptomyces sp. KL118A]